jgi:hypothetical protein
VLAVRGVPAVQALVPGQVQAPVPGQVQAVLEVLAAQP